MTATFDQSELERAYESALTSEKSGDVASAAERYRECLVLDPDDHAGAALRLAALGAGDIPPSAGDAYVATLFDQHADDFEEILVGQLQYGVPALMAERLDAIGPHRFVRGLDLGCGTGLVGEALRERVDTLIGVDLSEGMIETCFDKEIYDHLYIGEAVGFLEDFEESDPFDLIAAADVVPYVGDLDPLVKGVASRLTQGGIFAFSTESLDEDAAGGRSFIVAPDHRFHHTEAYLKDRLAAGGFELLEMGAITVRMQEGHPARGHLVIARRR